MPNDNKRRNKNKAAAPIRWADYARCSSDDQKYGDFTTIDNQREINRRHIQERIAQQGGEYVGSYADEGKTGTNLKRADWKRLLADAQAKKFDAVCVTYMSRLARGNAFHVAEFLLKEAGVQVAMVKEKFENDLGGQMQKDITIFADGVFCKQISDHTKTKMAAMVEKGYWCGVHPFGYTKVFVTGTGVSRSADKEPPKRLVPHEDEAPLVRHAYAMALGGATYADIARYLNGVTSRRWTPTTVKSLLTNETFTGVQNFGDWRNEHGHEAIVDRVTWDAVQEVVSAPRGRGPQQADDFVYYLRGRLRCPYCNGAYTQGSANGNSRSHYYRCSISNKYKQPCPVKFISAEALHHTVLCLLERASKHHTVMHKIIGASGGWGSATENQQAMRGQLAKKLQFIGVQINNMTNALADGRATDLIFNRLESLQEDRRRVEAELARMEGEIAAATVKRPTAEMVCAAWGQIVDLWGVLTEDERKEVMGTLVQEVVVTQKDRVRLRLSPIASVHGQFIALSAEMGAGRLVVTNYPPILFPDFEVPPLSRKTWKPRSPDGSKCYHGSLGWDQLTQPVITAISVVTAKDSIRL